jgi:folate-dependent phosphoribosylglycinamide formyltransferase PurN
MRICGLLKDTCEGRIVPGASLIMFMNDLYSIVFIGPASGVKPLVVLSSLLDGPALWSNILIVTDTVQHATPFLNLVQQHKLQHLTVTDLTLKDDESILETMNPDFLISCGWGAKLSAQVLAVPKIAALNCHSSFLPDYKGSSVYKHYWANCEEWMGATVHYMTNKFDEGNIVVQKRIAVLKNDTPKTMLERLSTLTAFLLREALPLSATGYQGMHQSGGRYFYKISGRRLRFHRRYNLLALRLGLPRYLTRFRVIPECQIKNANRVKSVATSQIKVS